ncbi:MAG: PQQ-binding-like beta-propeller repeat protein [Pirellulales bacterium]|nr:PQQ-binding-like beta-propeller repeat protein [Pirellulales bacterium]
MNRTFCRLLSLALLSTPLLTKAADSTWPRFRGPNGAGTSQSTTVPATWTNDDYRWRVELPGIGYSSPVIWGDRILVTSASEEDATQMIRCLRTGDGGLIWKREYASTTHPKHKLNCYASATPAVDEQRVYYVWATPEKYTVVALDQEKGEELWRRELGPFVAEHGCGASPVVFEGLVILPNDQDGESSTIALDSETGEVRWQTPRKTEKTAYATGLIYQSEGGPLQLIQSSWAHGISSLDPRTGKMNWELGVMTHRVVGSPAVASGLIIASCGGGGVGRRTVAVRPGDPAKATQPELAYEIKGALPYVPTPIAKDPLVFLWGDQGIVTCLDAPTGEVRWKERIGGNFFGSPVCVGDYLYCISREGELVVVAASDQYKLVSRIDLGERSNSTPAVAGGVMYLRTVSHLMAIGGSKAE